MRRWILIAVIVVAAAGMALLRHRCDTAGGTFDWWTISCAAGARPVILQGDIHRV